MVLFFVQGLGCKMLCKGVKYCLTQVCDFADIYDEERCMADLSKAAD